VLSNGSGHMANCLLLCHSVRAVPAFELALLRAIYLSKVARRPKMQGVGDNTDEAVRLSRLQASQQTSERAYARSHLVPSTDPNHDWSKPRGKILAPARQNPGGPQYLFPTTLPTHRLFSGTHRKPGGKGLPLLSPPEANAHRKRVHTGSHAPPAGLFTGSEGGGDFGRLQW
jgi:hypothetical protein